MTTNVVTKSLAGAEDILRGVDKVTQIRNGQAYEVNQLHVPVSVSSEAAMAALNPASHTYAAIVKADGTTNYIYSPTDTTGITSPFGGSWLKELSKSDTDDASVIVKQPYANALQSTQHEQNRFAVYAHTYGADPTFTLDSSVAIQNALNDASTNGFSQVILPAGRFKMLNGITIPAGVQLIGQGIDYWDTYRPSPTRLLKSWSKGTHLVFCGTGAKTQAIRNIMNARAVKTVNSVAYPFTDFTNKDSINGQPATARLFSAAVKATHASQIANLRIMLNFNGIDGYNDAATLSLGDEWDVGLWTYDSCAAKFTNIQVVGYWRIAGILQTENDGTYSQVGNPESTIYDTVLTQGRRGLLVRNAAQIDATANTSNSITLKYNNTFTLTADMKFKISGSATIFTATGYTVTTDTITLTGVTPALPSNVALVRAANIGNNFSGTIFSNFKACSLDHTSGTKSADLGLGEAGAMEIDGYPCRNLKFHNFKAQTTFDRLNTLYGDCRDAKFTISEHENGELIAYDITETQGYTGNIRFLNSDIQNSAGISAFTPRDCFIDYKQLPTMFNGHDFNIQNWRAATTRLRYFNGNPAIEMRDSDSNIELSNGNGFRWGRSAGSTNSLDFWGNNIAFSSNEATPLPILQLFAGSKNAAFYGNCSPAVDNTKSLGTASLRWSQVFAATGTINTSDREAKSDERYITEVEKVVALELKKSIKLFKFKDAKIIKGEDARLHAGVIAQEVRDIFAKHGLDAGHYGIYINEQQEYKPAITVKHEAVYKTDEYGKSILVTPEYIETIEPEQKAGDYYGIRYEELLCFIIAAM